MTKEAAVETVETVETEEAAVVVSPIALMLEQLTIVVGEETAQKLVDAYIETNHKLHETNTKPMFTMIRRGQKEILMVLGVSEAALKGVMGELHPRPKKAPKPKAVKVADPTVDADVPVVKKSRKKAAPEVEAAEEAE